MTKAEVIAKIKGLNLPKGQYIIYGATPLAVYEIREARDIDMFVMSELYKALEAKGWKKVYKGPKDEPVTSDIFEAHNTWDFSPYAPTFNELLSRAIEYEGIMFASLEDVRKWKEASGRPKDLIDLQLIDDYLKQKLS
ncbi:MAG TPA: hypothetical protein VNW29_03085 [Candidatus Sulfotelmatobacter sp.]|nr:hypothetical protein [Candidatus Sulfotelmatobacter sp.]